MNTHAVKVHHRHILELLSPARRGHDRVLFVTPRGVTETTFFDLWGLSGRIASAIAGTLPDSPVAGVLTPSAEMVACMIGCLRAGRNFVSLPLPARGQSVASYLLHLRTILGLAGAGAVIAESTVSSMLESAEAQLPCPILPAERLALSTNALRAEPVPGDLVQFSSGTTGTPKGIRLSGEAVAACVEALISTLRIGTIPEVFCGWVPLSHDMGLIGGLLTTWAAATRTRYRYVCMSPELFVSRPSSWLENCANHEATITAAPTFAYQVASRYLERTDALDLSKLRAAIVGAEPIFKETLARFDAAARRHGVPETALCPAYGLAEAALAVSMVPPEAAWSTSVITVDGAPREYVSCGTALECVRVRAPSLEQGPGPIEIAGPALCCGYVPERPGRSGEWLDTGDLGALAGAELYVTGRSDDLLCVAGKNIFAWELERAMYASPHVRAGACAVVSDGRGGYAAFFEPREPLDPERGCLFDVRKRLGSVAGIGPSTVGCLPRGTLPKTPSGKLQRNKVAADLTGLISTCLAYAEF